MSSELDLFKLAFPDPYYVGLIGEDGQEITRYERQKFTEEDRSGAVVPVVKGSCTVKGFSFWGQPKGGEMLLGVNYPRLFHACFGDLIHYPTKHELVVI